MMDTRFAQHSVVAQEKRLGLMEDNQEAALSHQDLMEDNQEAALSHQVLMEDNQEAALSHQVLMDNQEAALSHQDLMEDTQEAALSHQVLTEDNQEAALSHQDQMEDTQEAALSHQVLMEDSSGDGSVVARQAGQEGMAASQQGHMVPVDTHNQVVTQAVGQDGAAQDRDRPAQKDLGVDQTLKAEVRRHRTQEDGREQHHGTVHLAKEETLSAVNLVLSRGKSPWGSHEAQQAQDNVPIRQSHLE
jgi:hypothetical protein